MRRHANPKGRGLGMIAGDENELPCALQELIELSDADETALLGEIFTRGWCQGCLILDSADLRPPGLSPHAIDRLLKKVADRGSNHPSQDAVDPFEAEEMPQCVAEGQDAGLVILSQRCDVIKPLRSEPLVEIALAHRSSDPELIAAARHGGSSCYLHLVDEAPDSECGWLVDLRTRGHLSKAALRGRTPAQLLAPGGARRRFARRLGERSARIPVPTAIVDGFQRKLRDWLYSSAGRRSQCAHFSDFLLLPTEDESWAILAILGDGKDYDKAVIDFDALLGTIAERVDPFPISVDYSGVLRPEELSHADFLAAHPLDFKRVTYGSKSAGSGQAEPALDKA